MTPEQKELFDKLTRLQQGVATNFISGMSPEDSHKAAGGKCKDESNRRKLASEILTNPDVKAFVDVMKQEAVSSAVMTRNEMLERLTMMSRTSLSDLITWHVELVSDDDGGQKEQALWTVKESAIQDPNKMAVIQEVTAGRDGIKIKSVSSLQAMKQLAELAGYNAPTKTEHSGVIQQVNYSADDYKSAQEALEGKLS